MGFCGLVSLKGGAHTHFVGRVDAGLYALFSHNVHILPSLTIFIQIYFSVKFQKENILELDTDIFHPPIHSQIDANFSHYPLHSYPITESYQLLFVTHLLPPFPVLVSRQGISPLPTFFTHSQKVATDCALELSADENLCASCVFTGVAPFDTAMAWSLAKQTFKSDAVSQ